MSEGDHAQRIYQQIRRRLLRPIEQVDQLFTQTKMDMLREQLPRQRLKRQSKSVKLIPARLAEKNNMRLPPFEEPPPKEEEPLQALMYRTVQFEHNWGGVPVKTTSQWTPKGSSSPKMRSPRKSNANKPNSPELLKLLPAKFHMDRSSILNKNNLFLVPYLKSKIRNINSDFNVACVGDVPISYNYPPPPNLKQAPANHDKKRPTVISVPALDRPRRISLDSIKEIGPW